MKLKTLVPAIVFISILFSCNNAANHEPAHSQNTKQQTTDEAPLPVSVADSTAESNSPSTQIQEKNIDWDKKIIKTASLKLEVDNFKNYSDNLHQTIRSNGAYIAQEEQNISDDKMETVMSIKVPVAEFEDLMNQLAGNAKIKERRINTDDVTDAITDTKSRLEAKKQMRLKYLDFLKQAKNMEEALQVQKEINGIQEEIESAAGRITSLSHQSALSTINLTYYQTIEGAKPSEEVTPSYITRLANAFNTGGKWVAEFLIGLLSIWPLLLIVITSFLFFKKISKSKDKAQ